MIKVFSGGSGEDKYRHILGLLCDILELDDVDFVDVNHCEKGDVLITIDASSPAEKKVVIPRETLDKLFALNDLSDEKAYPERDLHGRFIAAYAGRRFYQAEINDFAAQLLKELEQKFGVTGAKRGLRVVLTHDVDNISRRNLYIYGRKVINALKHPAKAPAYLHSLLGPKDAYRDIAEFQELESSYGYRSTFYFLIGQSGRFGARYTIDEAARYIRDLDANGWEVGQHLNYYNYNDIAGIKADKASIEDVLGHELIGCRAHYLRFDVDDSFRILADAGFKYDTTLGFPDDMGFRSGVAYPYIPYRLRGAGKPLVELPLAIMEGSLFEGLGLTPDQALRQVIETLERYREQNAVIVLLWHPGTLNNIDYPGWGGVYRDILKYLHANQIKVQTAQEIAEEYLQRKAKLTIRK